MRVVPLEQLRDRIPFSVAVAVVERGFKASEAAVEALER